MGADQAHASWVIVVSLLFSMMLMVVPLPDSVDAARPHFTALCLLYWSMALPQRVGVGVAWLCGLLLDVMLGSLLGMHALSLSLICFLMLKLHQRVRVYPVWQQALTILLLIAMNQLIILWVRGVIDTQPNSWHYWLASLSSMLIWPLVYGVMRNMRRYYQVR